MKFFMYGMNMLLREENNGEGNDLGGAAPAEGEEGYVAPAAAPVEGEEGYVAPKPAKGEEGYVEPVEGEEGYVAPKPAKGEEGYVEPVEGEEGYVDPNAAPEEYEAFDLPAEYDGVIDDATMDNFSALAKDLDLTQEQAQKIVDYEVQRQTAVMQAYQDQAATWTEASMADEEIGGANHELKQAKAAKAYDALATDEFKSLMNPYHPIDNPTGLGLGNHPEVVRLFYRVGLNISEDNLVTGDTGGKKELEREEVMYPSS